LRLCRMLSLSVSFVSLLFVLDLGAPRGWTNRREVQAQSIPGLRLRSATDADLAHLQDLNELHWLNLESTLVTDAGLAHLKDLKGLHTLDLHKTKVTDAGVAMLKKALPSCNITH
jgi:hypothetical protein